MNIINVTDLGEGNIQVSLLTDSQSLRSTPPYSFRDPFSDDDKEEIRWYLEDYLRSPYEDWRAKKIKEGLSKLGESLFERVFTKMSSRVTPYNLYQEALSEGLDHVQMFICSDDPKFLDIAWELMRDPTPGRGFLALSLAGFSRLRGAKKVAFKMRNPDEPFRVLLVIARPFGEKDAKFGTVARPMIEALRSVRKNVEINVLRPPTFDSFVETLNSRKNYYDLVHFDGHGVFDYRDSCPGNRGSASGHLVFEREDGSEHIVSSRQLGQTLVSAGVPLFVLNACQSAKETPTDSFSSVASQLIAVGAKGVLAMSYVVYDTTMSKFMQRFYENIVGHASLTAAVKAARLRLYSEPPRETVFGPVELADWIVPTLYQQDLDYVPFPKSRQGEVSGRLEEIREACPEGRFGLIGRDSEILRIERAMYHSNRPWVLLTGLGGIGKTELALGFARWYAETGGCLRVFPVIFEQKAILGQIVRSVFQNRNVSSLSDDRLFKELVSCLRDNRYLLVLDDFQSVAGYPIGTPPLASDTDRKRLSRLMKELKGGRSRILVVTRKNEEDWLGVDYSLIELSGLNTVDSALLAKSILRTVGTKAESLRGNQSYLELNKLLKGHPRSMEIVLPHLRRVRPSEIVEALLHDTQEGYTIEDASLEYAFHQLSKSTQKHLAFMGLFASRVNVNVLDRFVGKQSSQRKVYKKIMGVSLNRRKWRAVLREAADNGLLRSITDRLFDLHPTLTPFLRRQLVLDLGEDNVEVLNAEFMKFYRTMALSLTDDTSKHLPEAINMIRLEEDNILKALWTAMKNQEWEIVIDVCHLLSFYYELGGRQPEWRYLRASLLYRIDGKFPNNEGYCLNRIWIYLLGTEASDAINRNDLSFAEEGVKKILRYLTSIRDGTIDVEADIAVAHFDLGNIFRVRGEYAKAEESFKNAMRINEKIGFDRHLAACYHHLGICAEEQYDIDKSYMWFDKALRVVRKLDMKPEIARTLHHLGNNALAQERFDDAEQFIQEAQNIRRLFNLESDAAKGYSELSTIARKRRQFDKAEELERKALDFFARLGMEFELARSYRSLGRIDADRGEMIKARQWYLKALPLLKRWETARSRLEIALTYDDLGQLALKEGDLDEAEKWILNAINTCDSRIPYNLAMFQANLGSLRASQGKRDEAIAYWSQSLNIARKYKMPAEHVILQNLAWAMNLWGVNEFKEICREVLESDAIIEDIKKFIDKQKKI